MDEVGDGIATLISEFLAHWFMIARDPSFDHLSTFKVTDFASHAMASQDSDTRLMLRAALPLSPSM